MLLLVISVIIILIVLVGILAFYWKSAYKFEDGVWGWVSYDEAVGKRVVKLAAVDNESFQCLSDKRYAKDKNQVFYLGGPILGADPDTFQVLSRNGYAKDKQHVFLDRTKVVLAEPDTFCLLRFPYSKDAKRIFCGTIPLKLEAEEVNEFKVKQELWPKRSMKMMILLSVFIEQNPEYSWLDASGIESIIVGEGVFATTKNKVFNGYKELEK
ncbi:MAG: DKNYY domain-containing protein [Bacteroidia bacterium]